MRAGFMCGAGVVAAEAAEAAGAAGAAVGALEGCGA